MKKLLKNRLAFDAKSVRTMDENGFLHVETSPITKEQVAEYWGREVPGWQNLGLNPNKIYKGYRPAEELQKAAASFNGLNILSEHRPDSAKDSQEGRFGKLQIT